MTSQLMTTALITLLLSSGCSLIGGGAGHERASGYDLSTPEGWKRKGREESDKAFTLPSGNIATMTSSCNENSTAPLEVLTRHLLMGSRDVKIAKREKVQWGSNQGLFTDVTAKLEGAPFHLNLFVTAKEGCVFDFSLVSPGKISESESKAFQDWITSFKYGRD